MKKTRVFPQPITCLNLAPQRNHQLFSEAQNLRCAALDILDRPYLDTAAFSRYQAKRQHADFKYNDAIENLRLIMTQYHIPRLTQHSENIRPSISLER